MPITSIKTRIFVAVAVLLAAIAGLVMTASRQSVLDTMMENEERNLRNTLDLVEANIRGRYRTLLKDKVRTVQSSKEGLRAFDAVVTETLDQFAAMADNGQVSDAEAQRLARAWLAGLTPVGGDYVFAFGPDDRALVYPERELLNTDLSRFTDVKGRSVVQAAREEALRYGETVLTYEWKAVGDAGLKPKYGHFVPYHRWGWIVASVGDVGAVRAQVETQMAQLVAELRETLPQVTTAGGGSVFILAGDGGFVVPPVAGAASDAVDGIQRRLRALAQADAAEHDRETILTVDTPDGDTLEARARYIRALGWTIATISSRDALRAPAEALVTRQAIVFGGALAVGLVLAYVFAHRIGQPLTRLAEHARALARTDFSASRQDGEAAQGLPVHRRDEVGQLAQAFVSMTDSLHDNVRSLMDATSARERIEGELNVARDIQLGLLPKVFPAFPERPEIDLCSTLVSAKEVGGDLFDYYFLDEHHLCFTIGDVAGKGVPAALFMAITKTLIKAAAERDADPAVMMNKVNDDLSQDNPNSIFVTLFIGILDVRTGTVRYANGGHNPPAILRRSGEVELLRARSGPAAGVMDGLDYASLESRLGDGDMLFLYTDGVTEAMNRGGVLYGDPRLFDLLAEVDPAAESATVVRRVMADVRAHADGAEQSDDITILALRYAGVAGGLSKGQTP